MYPPLYVQERNIDLRLEEITKLRTAYDKLISCTSAFELWSTFLDFYFDCGSSTLLLFLLSPKFHFAHSLYYFLLMKEKFIDLVFQNVKWEFVIGKEEHLKRNYEWIILMSLYGAWEICHLLMKPSWNHFSVFIIHITFFWTNFNAHCFCCKGKQSCTSFFPKGIGYVQICCWILFIILLYFCLRDIKYVSS